MSSPFSNPIAPGAPDPAPRPRDLEGCLVAYIPKAFTAAGAPGNDQPNGSIQPRDRVTADILLLDVPKVARGVHQPAPGMVYFGGSPDWDQDPKPHYLQVAGPAFFEGAWVNNQNIVRALAPNGQPLLGQMILGRIVRSSVGQKPFNLVAVDGTPDMALAIQIHSAIGMGQVAYQQPMPIPGVPAPQRQQQGAAAPMPPANSVQYAQPSNTASAYGMAPQQGFPQNAFPPPPQAPIAPPMPPQQPWQDPAVGAVQAAFPGAQVISQPVPGLYPGAPAMPGQVPPPPVPQPPAPPVAQPLHPALVAAGWTPENWASINDAQRQQVLATLPPQ